MAKARTGLFGVAVQGILNRKRPMPEALIFFLGFVVLLVCVYFVLLSAMIEVVLHLP